MQGLSSILVALAIFMPIVVYPGLDSRLSPVDHVPTSHATHPNYPANFSIDGDTRTCTRTDKLRPRFIRVNMSSRYKVKAVGIIIPRNTYKYEPANLTIYVIRLRSYYDASYHKCGDFSGTINSRRLILPCDGGELEGSYVHIEDRRKKVGHFALCEIQIFVHKDTYECGEPESPVHSYPIFGYGDNRNTSVEYRCDNGYKLLGALQRHCNLDGQWSHSQPVCQAVDCGLPVARYKPENYILVNGTMYGSVALLQCGTNETYLTCSDDGTWIPSDENCIEHVHTCSDLPVPIGGSVKYLPAEKRSAFYRASNTLRVAEPLAENLLETSAADFHMIYLPPGLHRVGTKAVIKCESKYYQLSGSRTRRCLKTGKWSGRQSICLPVCGRSESTRSPFIINGNATESGQWPWQAGIAKEYFNGWSIGCGASLLNELWVITAAHCVTYRNTELIIEPDEFRVYLGKYHRNESKDDEYVQVRKIQEIYIHPNFDPKIFDADIALIQLDSPVQFTHRVQPICLPTEKTTRRNLAEGKKGVVTGWGLNENMTFSETLRQAVVPVVSHLNCENGYEEAGHQVTVTEFMFCAGYKKERTDTCVGDSGGPFVFADSCSKATKWVLEGIISSGIGCGIENQYGVYTTVSKFLDWIHMHI